MKTKTPNVRFQKRIKVDDLITMNISKSGVSLTIGIPGMSINVGKAGSFLNLGIPGTGLSKRTKLDSRLRDNARTLKVLEMIKESEALTEDPIQVNV